MEHRHREREVVAIAVVEREGDRPWGQRLPVRQLGECIPQVDDVPAALQHPELLVEALRSALGRGREAPRPFDVVPPEDEEPARHRTTAAAARDDPGAPWWSSASPSDVHCSILAVPACDRGAKHRARSVWYQPHGGYQRDDRLPNKTAYMTVSGGARFLLPRAGDAAWQISSSSVNRGDVIRTPIVARSRNRPVPKTSA